MENITIENLYDLTETIAAELFTEAEYPWEVLPRIHDFILELGKRLPEEIYEKRGDQLIEQVVYSTAFGKTLIEEIRERLGGGHLFFPGVTPDLVIQIQAPAGIGHLVGHQLPGGHMMAPEQGFHELEPCFLPPGGIR